MVIYKTGTIEDKDVLKGSLFFNYHSNFTFHEIHGLKTKIETKKIKKRLDSLERLYPTDNLVIPPPPPPPLYETSSTYYYRFYSDRQEIIDELLSDRSYKCITLYNKKLVVENNKTIKLDDLENLKESLNDVDFLILHFGKDLKFDSYFKTLKFLKSEVINLTKEKNKGFHIIEISKEMEEIHKLNKIKFCN
jgi:hypothetical protein